MLTVDLDQLQAEVEDLRAEREAARREAKVMEQHYLEQVIMVSRACCLLQDLVRSTATD